MDTKPSDGCEGGRLTQRHAEARILIINAVYLRSLEVSSDFKLGF